MYEDLSDSLQQARLTIPTRIMSLKKQHRLVHVACMLHSAGVDACRLTPSFGLPHCWQRWCGGFIETCCREGFIGGLVMQRMHQARSSLSESLPSLTEIMCALGS